MKLNSSIKTVMILAAAALLNITATTAHAGGGRCEDVAPKNSAVMNGALMAGKTLSALEALDKAAKDRGEDGLLVAFIGRMGTDPRPSRPLTSYNELGQYLNPEQYMTWINEWIRKSWGYGKSDQSYKTAMIDNDGVANEHRDMLFSHAGLIFRDGPKSRWQFIHELNPCASKESNIYDEGLWAFFLDDPYEYGAQIMVPPAEHQRRIAEVILKDKLQWNFKGKVYNAVASPWNLNEQNSNSWLLEVYAAAMAPRGAVQNRAQAMQILKQTGFTPTRLHLRGFKYGNATNLLGLIARPANINIHSSEQPYATPYNVIDAVTVLSIEEYMLRNKWMTFNQKIYLDNSERITPEMAGDDDKPEEEKK